MKVIFLDIDGVLNSHKFLIKHNFTQTPFNTDEWWSEQIDPDAVERLNRLIEATGAKVVISSTWRVGKTPERMREILESRGFKGEIIGFTPIGRLVSRGAEIDGWLRINNWTSFVILDDDTDMDPVRDRLVQTTMDDGLLDEHVEEAIKLLKE